jgi:hypothetical protein
VWWEVELDRDGLRPQSGSEVDLELDADAPRLVTVSRRP